MSRRKGLPAMLCRVDWFAVCWLAAIATISTSPSDAGILGRAIFLSPFVIFEVIDLADASRLIADFHW